MSTEQQRVAGRELDAEIATRIFGAKVSVHKAHPHLVNDTLLELAFVEGPGLLAPGRISAYVFDPIDHDEDRPYWNLLGSECPRFSRDIAASFQVVEKMRETGYVRFYMDRYLDGRWAARFWRERDGGGLSHGETAALAICLAALAALDASAPAKASVEVPQ